MRNFETPSARCRVGLARCDITPPVGIYHRMWGAAKHDRATGVHRPLTGTVLLLEPLENPGAQVQLLIALDHCLLWAKEMEILLARLSSAIGVPEANIAVCFSHTHGAGLMGLERISLPGGDLIPGYLEEMAGKLIEAYQEARGKLQPATFTGGLGRCSLAAHRDFWDETTGQYVCGFNPEGVADDTIAVALIRDAQGNPLGTFVNYACHPTTLAFLNTLISPDFLGTMREVVEARTNAPCFFLQGASGDLGPVEGFVGDPAVADRNGRQLGYAILSVLESLPPANTHFVFTGPVISGATLGVWEHRPVSPRDEERRALWKVERFEIPLEYREGLPSKETILHDRERWQKIEEEARNKGNDLAIRDARAMIERMTRLLTRVQNLPSGSHFPLPAAILRIGDLVWALVEGEHYQQLQTQLRAHFPGKIVFVGTIVNGSRCTYLPPAEDYGKGIYQESIAVVAPGSLEKLTKVLRERIGALFHEE